MSYTIDEARCLILTTAAGVLTDAEVLRHVNALAADPRVRLGYRELADARQITTPAVTSGGLWQAATRESRAGPPVAARRLAIVADGDESFGIARMYQQMADMSAGRVRVFRDLAAARKWLGLPPDA